MGDNPINYLEENEMSKQEKLIKFYEDRLEKVKAMYAGDCRKIEYVEYAEKQLEEVRNGRDW